MARGRRFSNGDIRLTTARLPQMSGVMFSSYGMPSRAFP